MQEGTATRTAGHVARPRRLLQENCMVDALTSPAETPHASSSATETAPQCRVDSPVSTTSSHGASIDRLEACPERPVTNVESAAFRRVQDTFWTALDRGDRPGVEAAIHQTSGWDRLRLCTSPRPGDTMTEFKAHLPISVAAAMGATDILQILSQPLGACPYIGERDAQDPENPAYLPPYWATLYGEMEALRYLQKKSDRYIESVRALCARVDVDAVKWLVKKGVSPQEFEVVLRQAVLRDDAEGIEILLRHTKVERNLACYSTQGDVAMPRSLLALAIERGCYEAASQLVSMDTHPDGVKTDRFAKVKIHSDTVRIDGSPSDPNVRTPLMLAVQAGRTNLVSQLLDAGAEHCIVYLRAALALDREQAIPVYAALRRGGVRPTSQEETAELLQLASDKELDELYYLLCLELGALIAHNGGSTGAHAKQDCVAQLEQYVMLLDEWTPQTPRLQFLAYSKANFETDVVEPSTSPKSWLERKLKRKKVDKAAPAAPPPPPVNPDQALARRPRDG
jgi:hypothetical protein